MRVREVHLTSNQLLDAAMLPKFKPIVASDRMDRQIPERVSDDVRHDKRIERGELSGNAEAGLSLVERQKGMAGVIAHSMYQVDFPISYSGPFPDHCRTFAYMPPMWLPQTFVLAVRNSGTALETQVRLPCLPLPVRPGVDRFVAHPIREMCSTHVASDLFRREFALKQILDLCLQQRIAVDAAEQCFCIAPPPEHERVSMPLKVDASLVRIALQLARDRGAMLAQRSSDRGTTILPRA